MAKSVGVDVRRYRPEDEANVLELLNASLGGGPAGERPPEFFRWKHFGNPFGDSYMIVAEADGRIAGLRAFMRWRFRAGDRMLSGVRAVDTATHPDFQGRGVFSRLTLHALEELREESVDFVFNTPNPASLQGYLKMGWQVVGRVPISIRVNKPIRFVAGLRPGKRAPAGALAVDAPAAADVLNTPGLDALLTEANENDPRLRTPRDASYLRWRYGDAPRLDYRAVVEVENGSPRGVAILRVRPREGHWETTLSELIVRPGESASARRLLRLVANAAEVDHLACHFHDGSTAASATRRSGYIRTPRGMTFVVNPLREGIVPDPRDLRSWALSIGDLEVF
jgi:GNAT superfamily N-acetyltransferase